MSVALVAPLVSCSDDDKDSGSEPRMQVVLDYSPTLSDAGALLYLASSPSVDLLAVTLPGTGEADCEPGLRITRSLLVMTGGDDVPIGCGRNTPLLGDRDWPEEWRSSVNEWGNDLPPVVEEDPLVDAEQLLADTLRAATEPVTLVAVGPLTNLGVVLAEAPELADKVARIVIMGGAVTVPGNVEDSPAAEWNIYVDPEAARRVIAAGIAVTFVPLDATNFVAWNDRLVARLGSLESAAAQEVHRLAASRSLDGFYLWDELAAMAAVDPTLVTIESMKVRVDDDGAIVRDDAGFAVDVAISADGSSAIDAFVTGLNGGTAPPDLSLTAAELDYFVLMGGADSQFNVVMSRAFSGVDESDPDPRAAAASLFASFFDALDELAVALRVVEPPSTLRDQHAEYIASLSEFVERRDEVLAAVAEAEEGANIDEVLDSTIANVGDEDIFGRVNAACQALVQYSFLRDGPRPCTAGG